MGRPRQSVVGVLLLCLMAACGASQAEEERRAPTASPELMVIGDSISAPWRYNATGEGSKIKAWWAYVADSAGLDASNASAVWVDAIPGTGMLATGPADKHAVKNLDGLGEACGDDTPNLPVRSFGARLDDISLTFPPRVLILEGGRNDFKRCVNGMTQQATVAESKAAIDKYMDALAARIEAAGMAASDVFVVTPWGQAFPTERRDIRPLVEAAAAEHGFEWIPTPILRARDTVDGTHPDAAGTAWLARQIEANSDIVQRLKEVSTVGTSSPR